MNKAFEKIIDELKQESIIVDDDAGHRAVEIIDQIAEEYRNSVLDILKAYNKAIDDFVEAILQRLTYAIYQNDV